MAVSNLRRLLAQGALAAPGAWLLVEGVRHHTSSEMFFGGAVAFGAALLGRRSVVAQVLARGAAWAIVGPCLLALLLLEIFARGAPPLGMMLVLASATGALGLARPMLETAEARAAFAPLAFRRWFALAASGAVGCAVCLGTLLFESPGWPLALRAAMALLAGSLVGSAVGVARMRAWGILLGAVSALTAFGFGAFAREPQAFLALAALPGIMMVGGMLAARARAAAPRRVEAQTVEGLRIASPSTRVLEGSVAIDEIEEQLDEPIVQRARVS